MRRGLISLLLTTALALLSSGAGAQAVYTHAVQEGDTLASIAQRYYGDPTREAVLREANRMKGPSANGLVPGSWIFIPTVAFYHVGKDETWKSIAARFLGREMRAATLIEANSGNRRVEPDEGAELLIPYPLRHVVSQGETLTKIAKMYMPDSPVSLKRIRQFNAGARIERGQVVLVPLLDLRLAGEGRTQASEAFTLAAGGGATKAAQDEVESSLPELIEQVQNASGDDPKGARRGLCCARADRSCRSVVSRGARDAAEPRARHGPHLATGPRGFQSGQAAGTAIASATSS